MKPLRQPTMPRFMVAEYLDGDRESWQAWDRQECEIPEPFDLHVNLSCAEAEAAVAKLNADPALGWSDE